MKCKFFDYLSSLLFFPYISLYFFLHVEVSIINILTNIKSTRNKSIHKKKKKITNLYVRQPIVAAVMQIDRNFNIFQVIKRWSKCFISYFIAYPSVIVLSKFSRCKKWSCDNRERNIDCYIIFYKILKNVCKIWIW